MKVASSPATPPTSPARGTGSIVTSAATTGRKRPRQRLADTVALPVLEARVAQRLVQPGLRRRVVHRRAGRAATLPRSRRAAGVPLGSAVGRGTLPGSSKSSSASSRAAASSSAGGSCCNAARIGARSTVTGGAPLDG